VPTLKEAGFDVPVVPQVRGVVAPPGIPKENVEYWQELFRKLSQTESWKKYVADNQLESSCAPGPQLKQSIADIDKQMRELFQQSGIKMVR
jgi:putative tricarboxylic transport membrane protein